MKNKKLLILLIPATLLLWGMIAYKILSVASGGDGVGQIQETVSVVNNDSNILTDTFSINPTYRDPFLGKINKTAAIITGGSSPPKTTSTPKPIVTSPINKPFPSIIYGGLIKNKQSNKQLVLIQIGGQSTIMKIGDIVSEVELTKVFRDSIEVKFKKEKKFILK